MSDARGMPEFPATSQDEWLQRVRQVLKGKAFEILRSATADGIVVEPLYEPGSSPGIEAREERQAWTIVQRVDHPEPAQANGLALDDANSGATGLALTFRGAPSARGFGLKETDARSIGVALKDIPLHGVDIRLEAGAASFAAAEAMREIVEVRSLNPELIKLSFGMDPIGAIAAQGEPHEPWSDVSGRLAARTQELAQEFAGPFVEADGRIYHDRGGSEAQELGCVMATAVSYLEALQAKLDDDAAAGAVGITLAADADMFLTMAKFRAARLVWRELMAACGLKETHLKLHAETSWRMMTRQDAHGNLLRHVAAVFGAGLGGADSICVLPFSLAAGLPDGFARRMARNVQIILLEEANLHRISDPAAGAGYVDHLTTSLAQKAWAVFTAIEGQGRMVRALEGGFIEEMMRRSRDKRIEQLAEGKRAIVGVTAYANSLETNPSILEADPARPALQEKRDAEHVERSG
jgi:methylmalonyl-CoA mutase